MNKGHSTCARCLCALLIGVLLVLSLPVCLPTEAAQFAIPIEVVTDAGEYLSIENYNGTYILYLPGHVNRKAATIWYGGYGTLKSPAGQLKPGEAATFDLSGERITFEETTVDGSRTYDVHVKSGSKSVPSLHITLADGVSLSWLHADKENKGSGTLRMLGSDGREIYHGGLDTIKGRGNTSFTHPGLAADKKSYSIKLEKKAELIAGAGKAKKWALLHMRVCDTFHYDWTGLSNLLGYQMYSALAGEGYADVKAQFVDVYIDGDYRGVYILAERVAVNAAVDISDPEEFVQSSSPDYEVVFDFSDPAMQAGIKYYQFTADAVKKQDFDITGGYLLEVNTGQLEESGGFQTAMGMLVDIKAPEACTREQVSYIARYFQLFENALYSDTGYNDEGKHYSEYVDMDSLSTTLLTNAFMKNWELFRTSTYMYLDTADSDHPKLTFGPSWDFETGPYMFNTDTTFFSKHQLYVDTQTKCYNILGQLCTKGDLRQLMYEKQKELRKIVNAMVGSGNYAGVTNANTLWRNAVDSLEMNWDRWQYEEILSGKGGAYAGHANSYTFYAQQYIKALRNRQSAWNALWNENQYLLGLDVVKAPDDGKCTLSARIAGRATELSWYRLTEYNALEWISEAEGKTFIATEPGVYYCIATGASNVCYAGSESEILSRMTISFTSEPMVLTQADFVKPALTTTTTKKPGIGAFGSLTGGTKGTTGSKTTRPGGTTETVTTATDAGSSTTTTVAAKPSQPGSLKEAVTGVLPQLRTVFPWMVFVGGVQLVLTVCGQSGILGAALAGLFSWLPTILEQLFHHH